MITVKEMPPREKFELAEQNLAMVRRAARAFVHDHLGPAAVQEMENRWQEGTVASPDGASSAEQYEAAYANLMHTGRTAYGFVREKLGEEGVEQFGQAEANALIEDNASLALWMLALIRAFMPGRAFKMTAEQFAYKFQWLTPFTVAELSEQRTVYDIPACKILDYPGTDDLCHVACQRVYPRWIADQFKVKAVFEPHGKACTLTATPLY
ncbi:MAG: hypothetical protein RRC07_16585 [Anaerolineae bacterium]|nr:hypothetical protein [Anaerolineae bacterium]